LVRLLVVGAGGVGGALAAVLRRRAFFERVVFADRDLGRAERAASEDADRFAVAKDAASRKR
jgi:saccharopine dehydrogenase (NAD+, L-lysine forming)